MRKKINERATAMELRKGGKHDFIRKLILEGFFDSPVTTAAVVTRIRERFGKRLKPKRISWPDNASILAACAWGAVAAAWKNPCAKAKSRPPRQ